MGPFLIRILFISLTFLLTVASCGRQYGAGARLADGLAAIDSLLQTDPDSAYTLLERYERSRLVTHRDSAMFRLLWAEGRDKTFRDDTVADEITRTVDFFRKDGDRHNLMRSLYYLGRIRQNAKSYGAAIIAFQEGVENADSTELLYRGKIHTAASETASAIDDWPRMEEESRKALECYIRLDSTIFIREAKLWYTSALAQNNKTDSSLNILHSLYKEVSDNGDIAFIDTVASHLANTYLWRKNFHEAGKYLKAIYERENGINMQLRDLNFLLWSMMNDHAPQDSIDLLAEKIADKYGKEKVWYEYYASVNDYPGAYNALLCDHNSLDSMYGDKVRDNTIYLINQSQESRIAIARLELKLEKERRFRIIVTGLILVGILIVFFVRKAQRDKRKIKDLLASVSVVSRENNELQKAATVEVPLLKKIISSLDLLYSEYYRTNEKERKGILGKMGEAIDRLRNDENLLKELEMEINRCSDNILDDIYTEKDRLTVTQRRLAAYLYFGLSTETICELLQVAPDAYYNRKSRLLDRIKKFESPRRDELIRMISGSKC